MIQMDCNEGLDSESEADYENEIDLKWVQEYDKLVKVENNYIQETMDSVSVCVFYMNKERTIKTIISDKIALFPSDDGNSSILSKDRILQFILSKKVHLNVKYDLFDILYFNFPLESENFYSFVNQGSDGSHGSCGSGGSDSNNSNMENTAHYLRIGTIINDIHFEKSVFIFHEINMLYFFLVEKEAGENHRHTLKSILKKGAKPPSKEETKEETRPIPSKTKGEHNGQDNGRHSKEHSKKVRIVSKPSKSYRAFTKKVYTSNNSLN